MRLMLVAVHIRRHSAIMACRVHDYDGFSGLVITIHPKHVTLSVVSIDLLGRAPALAHAGLLS